MKNNLQGIVLKAFGGFFYVQTTNKVWECRPRGRFKKERQTILVGDYVEMSITGDDTGVVELVKPRSTELVRPPIVNVEQVLVVLAARNPDPNLLLLDRLLIMAEASGVQPVICFNKWDLLTNGELDVEVAAYRKAGYQVIGCSAKAGLGVEEVRQVLKDKVSVIAGPSGAGKSTLLNTVQAGLNLKTGEISEKIKRGKHTTRHVELLPLADGGWVADTPGFSTLNLPVMTKEELSEFFPEINRYVDHCRFRGCLHRQEPGCAVSQAVEAGDITERRFQQYLTFLTEIMEQKERRY